MVNDVQPGENAEWPFVNTTLSVVNIKTLAVEKIVPLAHGGQVFENETLPEGACFVPRIVKKDSKTLRCFFAGEAPKQRQAQTCYLDFNVDRMAFESKIHRPRIKTAGRPRIHARAEGFRPVHDRLVQGVR